MMARSRRSNERPDTVMQDRINQVDETSCTARPDHTVGSDAVIRRCPRNVRFAPGSGRRADIDGRQVRADIVAKVAAAPLWNSNLKQSNRDVRTFESMLRLRVKT